MVRCPLRTSPNHPLTSNLVGLTRSILVFHSRERSFFSNPPFPYLRLLTPLTFQLHLAWTHSRVRRTFSDASTCPGVTSPPPLGALRAFNLPQFAYAKRSFDLLLPVLAQGEEGFNLFSPTLAWGEEVFLNLFLAWWRSENLILVPPIAGRRWGLKHAPLIAGWWWGLTLHVSKILYWMHAIWIYHCVKLHKGHKISPHKLETNNMQT